MNVSKLIRPQLKILVSGDKDFLYRENWFPKEVDGYSGEVCELIADQDAIDAIESEFGGRSILDFLPNTMRIDGEAYGRHGDIIFQVTESDDLDDLADYGFEILDDTISSEMAMGVSRKIFNQMRASFGEDAYYYLESIGIENYL